METVAEHVVLSSHLVADVERTCDYLIVLVSSRVHLAGDVKALLACTTDSSVRATRPCRLAKSSSNRT
jgi:ABC-type Na+ transport system ATPase subunit NatA